MCVCVCVCVCVLTLARVASMEKGHLVNEKHAIQNETSCLLLLSGNILPLIRDVHLLDTGLPFNVNTKKLCVFFTQSCPTLCDPVPSNINIKELGQKKSNEDFNSEILGSKHTDLQ